MILKWIASSAFRLLVMTAVLFAFLNVAHAQDFSALSKTGMAQVLSVVSPYNLLLDDGRIVRLSGVEFPDGDVDTPGIFAATALDVLKDMLEGKTVDIYQTRKKDWGRVNRMSHELAHLVRHDDELWVQGALLQLGLARVQTSARNPEMAPAMLQCESMARASKDGLWDVMGIISPEQAARHKGSFQIVEGRVISAGLKNNTIYLNFGPDWRTDFTAVINAQDRRIFSRARIDPLQWNDHVIRVRGWIEDHNGPAITLTHPEAVEILDGALPLAPQTLRTAPGTLLPIQP